MKLQKRITVQQRRRAYRVRNRVRAGGRLRLSVFRSNKHIYAQIIDDARGQTLVSASTAEADFRASGQAGGNTAAAAAIGKRLADRAKEKGIHTVAFDRGPYRYHGRIKALADAARAAGLEF
jgi:large subunit ribosomal protein L18|uniref:Large ribosomal subunit protein uL18 n=1 Tax=Schlesneria paludicola TaxID=360056 RepID=A0A7C4LL33_9PLAN